MKETVEDVKERKNRAKIVKKGKEQFNMAKKEEKRGNSMPNENHGHK